MPTLAGDKQMVLPIDTVMYQSQEVAAVVATTRYIAADGVAAVLVDYEPLPVIVDPHKALEPDAFVLRPDRGPDKQNNHIWHWESGDRAAADAALAAAEVDGRGGHLHPAHPRRLDRDVRLRRRLGRRPRPADAAHDEPGAARHPDRARARAVARPAHEQNIRVKTHDIGGGFGGKVPVYPGYVLAVAASFLTVGKPVKWIEDRSENLQADSFARDYHIHAELGATKDGKITGLKVKTIADHGYTDAAADPSKFPAGLFNVITGSYDFPDAFVEVDGVYTNKPPGGVAYRCSFRVTEAVHAIERMVDILAHDIGKDPAQLRMENFIQPEQFPYKTPTGWSYDSGNYPAALQKAMDMIDYAGLRQEQAEKRERGELMGIGISSFTEIVGAGPSHDFDILGLKMFDSCEIRVHPTGKVLARIGVQTQGQGHETTFAQIIAEELGFPVQDIKIEYGDTDTAPYGLGTYASRSTPVAGAATAMAVAQDPGQGAHARRAPARGRPRTTSSGSPASSASRARPTGSRRSRRSPSRPTPTIPQGMEAGLEAVDYYDPPNLTFPFGSYICVVDIDKGTGRVNVRRFVAVDDCGNIINPMIVDGQIHGGLTMGLAPALYEEITYDELGNNMAGTFMDYLVPTAVESPAWETGKTITPSPHHPIGAKGVGESATVGAPPAIANAVVDALWHLGVRNIDIPITPQKVWAILHEKGIWPRPP